MTKVLVVDDALVDRKLAGKCIEQEGMTPCYAEDGGQAIEMVNADPPDLVITDLQMPGMDGLDLVTELQATHPGLPVILMTAFGSEEIAVKALQIGAASYVPKRNLKRELGEILRIALEAAQNRQDRREVFQFLGQTTMEFELGYHPTAPAALVGYLQDCLQEMQLCTVAEKVRIGTALTEALTNAYDHGNLELDSDLREQDDNSYRELAEERKQIAPYKDRRVRVSARFEPTGASFTFCDEGNGFDYKNLPDPLDPENMLRASGRGLLLIETFMDEVRFNDTGNEITLVKHRTTAA